MICNDGGDAVATLRDAAATPDGETPSLLCGTPGATPLGRMRDAGRHTRRWDAVATLLVVFRHVAIMPTADILL